MSYAGHTNPVISPNGESIISFGDSILQLWHIENSPMSSLNTSIQASQNSNGFLLEFSPDGSLVAVVQKLGNTVTILDIKSSNQQPIVIDTDTVICGIGFTGSKCHRTIFYTHFSLVFSTFFLHTCSLVSLLSCYHCFPPCFHVINPLFDSQL